MVRGIQLDDLATHAPALTTAMAMFYRENCMVCMDNQGHTTGVMMEVNFADTHEGTSVSWHGTVTDATRASYDDREKRVDFGACGAIALLLMPEFAGLRAVRPSAKGNAIDYYLAPPDEEHLIFNEGAVLEVSGIQAENPRNTVADRIYRKRRRLHDLRASVTSQTPDPPTYICVVEFGQPKARVVLE